MAGVPTPDAFKRGVFLLPPYPLARFYPDMRRRFYYSLLFLVAIAAMPLVLRAQAGGDTLSYDLGREILVTATRLPMTELRNPAAVELFDAGRLAMLPARSLGDALRLAGGAHMMEYGASGSLQLPSFRGLGAEYAVIYYNGVRLNHAQNGLVDMSRIPLYNIDRVEIARGGLGALYGSDALGAVVDLRSGGKRPLMSVRAGAGSFGWSSLDMGADLSSGALRFGAAATQERARNDFPFHSARYPEGDYRRAHADMLRRSASANAAVAFERSMLDFSAALFESDIGVPGAFTSWSSSGARQHDLDLLLSARYFRRTGDGAHLTAGMSFSTAREAYKDPAIVIDGVPLHSRFENSSAGLNASFKSDISPSFRLLVGAETSVGSLTSDEVAGNPLRLTAALFATADIGLPVSGDLRLHPSLRADRIEDRPGGKTMTELSPSLALKAGFLNSALSMYLRVGHGFRAPTFNQLFWLQGGNQELNPEYSNSFEIGANARIPADVKIDLALFRHDIEDKIVWTPGRGAFWTPRNIKEVRSTGVELPASGALISRALRWRATAVWMSARKMNAAFPGDATQGKRLAYAPDMSASAELEADITGGMSVGLSVRHLGKRYSSETNDPASELSYVTSLDAVAVLTIPISLVECTLKAELMNALDAAYEVIAYYPMPGISFRFSTSISLINSGL